MCGVVDILENEKHLFFECPIIINVWNNLLKWLVVADVFHSDITASLQQFGCLIKGGKVVEEKLVIIWFACV